MITHSVYFKLKHDSGSEEEQDFLNCCKNLGKISEVQNYKIVKELNPKNNYDYGIVMEFESDEDYHSYNNHPEHTDFVEKVWIPNVSKFLEIDYEVLS